MRCPAMALCWFFLRFPPRVCRPGSASSKLCRISLQMEKVIPSGWIPLMQIFPDLGGWPIGKGASCRPPGTTPPIVRPVCSLQGFPRCAVFILQRWRIGGPVMVLLAGCPSPGSAGIPRPPNLSAVHARLFDGLQLEGVQRYDPPYALSCAASWRLCSRSRSDNAAPSRSRIKGSLLYRPATA